MDDDDDAAVYINPKSNIWHTRDCSHFRPTFRRTTVDDAEGWGRPCAKCVVGESYRPEQNERAEPDEDLIDAARQSIEARLD